LVGSTDRKIRSSGNYKNLSKDYAAIKSSIEAKETIANTGEYQAEHTSMTY
jgi:cell fate (sporulation/competence/biofilm development) regulator YlbF (YheA/YmcA/DUF963 family)